MKNYEIPKLKLTTENVEKIFLDCFLPENYTDDTKVIPVNAVTGNFGFDPEILPIARWITLLFGVFCIIGLLLKKCHERIKRRNN